jgi:monoamine oxidase
MSADIDVVIVGGGAAGIGAARRLAASGRSALLLEATARLGGRAWTHHVHGLPLDLGCGWLHSAERNAWIGLAEAAGLAIERGNPAWGIQYGDLGFTAAEQAAARDAYDDWNDRLADTPPASDCAADALEPEGEWNGYIQAITGFVSGARLDRLSVADYMAYDAASSDSNWRVPMGYGSLVAASFPEKLAVRLATPVEAIELEPHGVRLTTPAGTIRARAAILTVSTAVLAGDTIKLPGAIDPWREAAGLLPLGRNEKLFLGIAGEGTFAPETYALGDPRDGRTGAYYIRPFGRPVIECFVGGDGAGIVEEGGPVAGFAYAIDQLAGLFGEGVRRDLRPLVASDWGRLTHMGGGYSYALPGHAAARQALARPFEQPLFFAGEATSPSDFSTAHGAHDSGVRAADEAIAALASRAA